MNALTVCQFLIVFGFGVVVGSFYDEHLNERRWCVARLAGFGIIVVASIVAWLL